MIGDLNSLLHVHCDWCWARAVLAGDQHLHGPEGDRKVVTLETLDLPEGWIAFKRTPEAELGVFHACPACINQAGKDKGLPPSRPAAYRCPECVAKNVPVCKHSPEDVDRMIAAGAKVREDRKRRAAA